MKKLSVIFSLFFLLLCLFNSPNAYCFTDTDGDLLPDSWEQQYPTAADPASDPDGDRLANLDEFHANTNPLQSTPANTLTETQLLKLFQGKTFLFFWEQTSGAPYYFAHDNSDYNGGGGSENFNSNAGIGFSFVSYVIADQNDWVSHAEAYNRIRAALARLVELQNPIYGDIGGPLTQQGNRYGYTYHFINNDGWRAYNNVEISTIDHALLTAGALVAASYYRGTEVEMLAHQLFDNTQWNWLYDGNVFYQGWSEGCSAGQNCIEGGHTSDWWNRYSELMILLFQTMSADSSKGVNEHAWQYLSYGQPVMFPSEWAHINPYNPSDPKTFTYHNGLPVSEATGFRNDEGMFRYIHAGSIHNHQYSHMYADFRNRADGFKGTNFFNNSVNATMANRQYCIRLNETAFGGVPESPDPFIRQPYETYGPDSWGLLAGIASDGNYKVLQPIVMYWDVFTVDNIAANNDSSTVFLYAAPASTAFTPKESIGLMKNIFSRYQNNEAGYDALVGHYGFMNSYNHGRGHHRSDPPGHYSAATIAIDQGAVIESIENYLTGMVWKLAMQQSRITNGMARAGVGFNVGEVEPAVMNFDNGSDPTSFGGFVGAWDTGSAVYENIGDPYPAINYGPQNWSIKISVSGTGDGAFMTLNNHSVSQKDRVSFWIKGNTTSEDFWVGLKDSHTDYKGESFALEQYEHKVRISDYIPGGSIPNEWIEVRIPLLVFEQAGVRLTRLDNISFTNEKAGGGQICVDDIAFLGDEFKPEPPVNVQKSVQPSQVEITWDENTETDVVGYNIYRWVPGTAAINKLNGENLVVSNSYVDTDPGTDPANNLYAATAVDNSTFKNESVFSNEFFFTVHHKIEYLPKEQYSSAGAAKMILNYMKNPVSQADIYNYGIQYNQLVNQSSGKELDPDGMATTIGHFDPYDPVIANPYNSYDSLPGGNPYQGYNFSVEMQLDIHDYMRDLAHWMDYPSPLYWGSPDKTNPAKVPPAVPIFGSQPDPLKAYNYWIVVNGFSASRDPLPDENNPWYTPDFTVYGFWLTDPTPYHPDPKLSGIGVNRFVTASEAALTYFKPLTAVSGDKYNGKFVLVAEPPPVMSTATVEISDFGTQPLDQAARTVMMTQSAYVLEPAPTDSVTNKKSRPNRLNLAGIDWSKVIPPFVLDDPSFSKAYSCSIATRAALVKSGGGSRNYYIVAFDRYVPEVNRTLTSVAIALDTDKTTLREATWMDQPVSYRLIQKSKAINLVLQTIAVSARQKKLLTLTAVAELIWEPVDRISSSPFEPYWKVLIGNKIYYVKQDGTVLT